MELKRPSVPVEDDYDMQQLEDCLLDEDGNSIHQGDSPVKQYTSPLKVAASKRVAQFEARTYAVSQKRVYLMHHSLQQVDDLLSFEVQRDSDNLKLFYSQ